MKVSQTAGDCSITVFTDGFPLWPVVELRANNGDEVKASVSIATLHDLRYCIDRVLSQLPEGKS